MEKVKLTKEQADSLRRVKLFYNSDVDQILTDHADFGNPWVGSMQKLNELNMKELATALINGYEVEQTPEEKLREYYTKTDPLREPASIYRERVYAERRGIEETLNILGIKIKGINAKEDE